MDGLTILPDFQKMEHPKNNKHRRAQTVTHHHTDHSNSYHFFPEHGGGGGGGSLSSPAFKMLQKKAQSFSGKFYAKSHLLSDTPGTGNYLSLWLIPPEAVHKSLVKDITKMSLRYNGLQSSAPFTPHVTVLGSIPCGESLNDARKIGKTLQKALQGSGPIPCRFRQEPCRAMYREDTPMTTTTMNTTSAATNSNSSQQQPQLQKTSSSLVWSQACISIMERSVEYMALLDRARHALDMPPGEWMFPAPACEPHLSKFYGHVEIPHEIPTSPDFVAVEVALWSTNPGTVEGVQGWKEVTRINLLSGSCSSSSPTTAAVAAANTDAADHAPPRTDAASTTTAMQD
jgi:hypothetical protein